MSDKPKTRITYIDGAKVLEYFRIINEEVVAAAQGSGGDAERIHVDIAIMIHMLHIQRHYPEAQLEVFAVAADAIEKKINLIPPPSNDEGSSNVN